MRWVCSVLFLVACSVARAETTFEDVAPIISKKCAVCHTGPFLDLRTFPFKWSGSADQKVVVDELLRRINAEGSKRMPPKNGVPLTCEEILLLESWRADGALP